MATFRKKVEEKYGTIYNFAQAIGWSYQKAYYRCTRDVKKMNQLKFKAMLEIIGCTEEEL